MDESVICLEDSPEVIDLSETMGDVSQDFSDVLHEEFFVREKSNKKNRKQNNDITPAAIIDLSNESDIDLSKELVQQKEQKRKSSEMCCPICFDKYVDVQLKATKCGHVFCNDCIVNAVKEKRNCPTCRQQLTLKDLIPLYL